MNEINLNKIFVAIDEIADKYKDVVDIGKLEKIKADTRKGELRIAVIGKMKAGKSTLTNALIFQDKVLAASPEPTTVTLTEISYLDNSENDTEIQVETLTKEDIQNLERQAADNANEEKSKVAQKILEDVRNIPGGCEQFLGKSLAISEEELAEYTSSSGKLCGLAKKVQIKKKNDLLKGITIIDTPGFNDPVVSRVETTKQSLSDCNIILFVHDTLSKYDNEEMSMLTEQIEKASIVDMVDVVNRMDENDDMPIQEWQNYRKQITKVKSKILEQISKESKAYELLLGDKIVCVSAYMALIGYIVKKYGTTNVDDEIGNSFIEYRKDFDELKDAHSFIKWSYIPDVIKAINELSKEKSKYLVETPIEALIGMLKDVADDLNREIQNKSNEIKDLKMSAAQAQEKLSLIDEIFTPVRDAIQSSTLHADFDNEIAATKRNIQNKRENMSMVFTENNYPEPEWPHRKDDRKNNLSNYNNIIYDFNNQIRNEEYDLKDKFSAKCDNEINNICKLLIKRGISDDNKEYLEGILRNQYHDLILKGISIDINSSAPNEPLEGELKQYALYKSDFAVRFGDSVIDKNLESFRNHEKSELQGRFRMEILKAFDEVKKRLKSAIKSDPTEKNNKIQEAENRIKECNDKLQQVTNDIEKLQQLKNTNYD